MRSVLVSINHDNFNTFFQQVPEAYADFEVRLSKYNVNLKSVLRHPMVRSSACLLARSASLTVPSARTGPKVLPGAPPTRVGHGELSRELTAANAPRCNVDVLCCSSTTTPTPSSSPSARWTMAPLRRTSALLPRCAIERVRASAVAKLVAQEMQSSQWLNVDTIPEDSRTTTTLESSREKMIAAALALGEKYVFDGAPSQVNIKGATRSKLVEDLDKSDPSVRHACFQRGQLHSCSAPPVREAHPAVDVLERRQGDLPGVCATADRQRGNVRPSPSPRSSWRPTRSPASSRANCSSSS
jgi:hypothetical protein